MAEYDPTPIRETQGDTFSKSMKFTVDDDNNSEKDITGWTIYVTAKRDLSDDDVDAVLSQDVTSHDDAAAGETSFSFPPSDTEDLSGPYWFEIKYEDTGGTVETIVSRALEFKKAVRSST